MSLSAADIARIANLAYLSLSSTEVVHYTEQLSQTLQFIEQMSAVDTEHVAPCVHVNDFPLPFRTDVVTEKNEQVRLQEIAPEASGGFYLVPTVLEDHSDS